MKNCDTYCCKILIGVLHVEDDVQHCWLQLKRILRSGKVGSHSLFFVIRVFRKDLSMKNCAKVNKHGSQWHICSSENICYIFNCWNCSECLTYSFQGLSDQPYNLHFLTLKFIIFLTKNSTSLFTLLFTCLVAS